MDWLSVSTASVAAAAVLGTAVFAGAQIANASPAAEAVQVLTSQEATLDGAESALAAAKTRVQERVQQADAGAARVRAELLALSATEEHAATADAPALAAALGAVDAYRAALAEVTLPDLPAPYERRPLDEESLVSVGEALDRVQLRSADVDAATAQLRGIRASLDELDEGFSAQLSSFASSFTAHAAAEIKANPSAGETFQKPVAAAAAALGAISLESEAGAAALESYRDAVIALRAEDLRVREQEEAEREAAQNQPIRPWQPANPTPTPTPGTDPGTTVPEPDPGTGGGEPEPPLPPEPDIPVG